MTPKPDIAPPPKLPTAADPLDCAAIQLAAERVAHAETRLALAQAQRDALFGGLRAKYQLGEKDAINVQTGVITRAGVAEPEE